MKKDITLPKVEHVGIAIVPENGTEEGAEWNVYLINTLEDKLEGVLVSSRGYGEKDGRKVETTQLRHFLDEIDARSYSKVEPIMEDVFGITNEYWVSYYLSGKMYDKKFIFVPGSMMEENLTKVPVIDKKGILII